jgi:guanosine-3',5'-bis(diphosphate) 3'-pyrophosphohydrolase
MPESSRAASCKTLLDAVAFAARAHEGQYRKDRKTPYVSHSFRVCLVAREVFGVTDHQLLTAAVLHDTVEDTTTDFEDLECFGSEVARWVALLSKDKRLPEVERERAYVEGLSRAPWQVRMCKLADMFDNLTDSATIESSRRADVLGRLRYCLEGLKPTRPDETSKAWQLVADLLVAVEANR